MGTSLRQNAITETYNDMQSLISNVVWKFYKKYGGDFEEWKAEANLIFIKAYNTHKKNKGQFSTWLYFCVWKRLLDYSREIHKQVPINYGECRNEDTIKNLEDRKNHSFSSLEFLDGVGEDAKTLIYLIWNFPHDLPISKGNNPCHMKVALRNYLRDAGWTGKRIKETFKEITEIVNG